MIHFNDCVLLPSAMELVTNPTLFLADEATSGLDSAQAQKVFNAIAKSARGRNIPCICTLHQPRASIWKVNSRPFRFLN